MISWLNVVLSPDCLLFGPRDVFCRNYDRDTYGKHLCGTGKYLHQYRVTQSSDWRRKLWTTRRLRSLRLRDFQTFLLISTLLHTIKILELINSRLWSRRQTIYHLDDTKTLSVTSCECVQPVSGGGGEGGYWSSATLASTLPPPP